MRVRAALNHYLTNYDIIFTDIIEAIIGKTTKTSKMFNKNNISEKLLLREYLSKLMTNT